MTLALHPGVNYIKKFEVTYRPLGSLNARKTVTVTRGWIVGHKTGDWKDFPLPDKADFERGEILDIRPIREGA